uniref:Uncharacterized protein n=1 Tax=Meloidogyne hapla TaxID=6305 RepID=A0A1I8BZL1_MELHA
MNEWGRKRAHKWLNGAKGWFQHWSKPLTDAIKQALPGTYEEQLQLLQSHLNNRMCNALQRFREWRRSNPTLTEFPLNIPNSPSSSSPSNGSIRNLFESLLDSHEESFIPFFALTCLAQYSTDDDKSVTSDLAESEDDVFVIDMEMNQGQLLQGNSTSVSFQDWRTILRYFVMAPQFFQDEQIKSLLSILNDGLSRKCKTRLLKLFNIREQTCANDEQNTTLIDQSTYSIKTLGDLQSQIVQNEENPDCTFICDPLTMEDDWSLASNNELGPSLGLTSDQTADSLCLALESNFS